MTNAEKCRQYSRLMEPEQPSRLQNIQEKPISRIGKRDVFKRKLNKALNRYR